jgi:hypothetical protein
VVVVVAAVVVVVTVAVAVFASSRVSRGVSPSSLASPTQHN